MRTNEYDDYIDTLLKTLNTVFKTNETLISEANALNELLDAVELERDEALIALGRKSLYAVQTRDQKALADQVKNISECTDCLDAFCETCDEDRGRCPDCKSLMCGDCFATASENRQNRCSNCSGADLGSIAFPYSKADRKIHKHYSAPQGGKLG